MTGRSVKKGQVREQQERLGEATEILKYVSEDTTTPRNIRRAAKEAIDSLQVNDYTPAVRAANAISTLDEISQDPNMPAYTRVRLYKAVSILEAIKD